MARADLVDWDEVPAELRADETWKLALYCARKGNVAALSHALRSHNLRLTAENCLWLKEFIANTRFLDLDKTEIERAKIRRFLETFNKHGAIRVAADRTLRSEPYVPPQSERDEFSNFLLRVLVKRRAAGNSTRLPWEPKHSVRNKALHRALKQYRELRKSDPDSSPQSLIATLAASHCGDVPAEVFQSKLENRLGMNARSRLKKSLGCNSAPQSKRRSM